MGKSKKTIIIIGVLVILVTAIGIGLVVSAQSSTSDGIPRNAVTVEIVPSHRETIEVSVTATGKAAFVEKTSVYPSTQAKIEIFDLKVGDVVKEGDLLAVYDKDTLDTLERQLADAKLALESAEISLGNIAIPATEAELLQAQNSVKSAQKSKADLDSQLDTQDFNLETYNRNLKDAQDNYEKNKILYANNVISKAELDNYEDAVTKIQDQITAAEKSRSDIVRNYDTASASLELAEKQLDALINKNSEAKVVNQLALQRIQVEQSRNSVSKIEDQIDDFVLEERSKVSGTVISIGYSQGETASPAKALVTIADVSPGNLIIAANIPENDAASIKLGQPVEITGNSIGDKVYEGKVSKISPTVEMAVIGTSQEPAVAIEISIDENNAVIKSGNSLDLKITTAIHENVVVIPLMSTVLDSDNSNYVYIVQDDSKVVKRTVKLLQYANLNVQVEGVEEGEKVVNNPPVTLSEGMYVRPGGTQTEVQPLPAGMQIGG